MEFEKWKLYRLTFNDPAQISFNQTINAHYRMFDLTKNSHIFQIGTCLIYIDDCWFDSGNHQVRAKEIDYDY